MFIYIVAFATVINVLNLIYRPKLYNTRLYNLSLHVAKDNWKTKNVKDVVFRSSLESTGLKLYELAITHQHQPD